MEMLPCMSSKFFAGNAFKCICVPSRERYYSDWSVHPYKITNQKSSQKSNIYSAHFKGTILRLFADV